MYSNEEKVIIWLNSFDFLSLKKLHQFVEMYPDCEMVWNNFESDKEKMLEIVTEEQYTKMLFSHDESFLNNYIRSFDSQNVKIVTIKSKTYPQLLRETISPPVILYCRGNVDLLKTTCVAIVGTRRCTKYGKEVTYRFAYDIANSGLTVVSGLADGVDSVAHTATLDAKGHTIAVLACGINNCYPATNKPLYDRIVENDGLIISEHKPNEKALAYYFPARNRIIAGLSKGVLITEATEKSGSMHTKEYALENNRDLYVVPGRITDIYSSGCNAIIKNCQSTMVLSPDEIINAYGRELHVSENTVVVQTNMDEQLVLNILKTDELSYDEILEKSGLEPKTLNTLLMRLELKGLVNKLPGNYYGR